MEEQSINYEKKLQELQKENVELKAILNSPSTMLNGCPFSSRPNARNNYDETPSRQCSWKSNLMQCHMCRVASDWEEAYGG